MVILGKDEIKEIDVDTLAMRVFLKSLELIGGPRKIIEYRKLTWIPSLIEASYAVVFSEEMRKSKEEIAEILGITKQTVQNIFRTGVDAIKEKITDFDKSKEIKAHTAGGLARWAYEEIKKGNESINFLQSAFQQISDIFEISWPIEVLRRIKGHKFPMEKKKVKDLLGGLKIENKTLEEILNNKNFPNTIDSPSHLLKIIKEITHG
ncbi:bacterio-opsin activator [Candidatus Aminicenantes bacterium AC-335-B20]|jgi:probable regulatory domain-containing protein|nr:bacterio-opsin activator [SCandidatus Aminicenantes bacterium Aminicenantia_JdfR_composite]MCP2596959.1 bacterio-opsin activator [Candidatus Aminicenantes bacterium AC-335-G13]MCP2599100.1 bacterio-opsin activator [Candidatus Aminicenantes bacterium AC-335-B20]MCP2605949.1 bacterio-opsin activator [Candidatus Aminicenantes bacterium AC-708-I09]MCP2618288.1 bacterio-opsin activator [Candidatus Aminicenantes bacterium AC-335-A11]MCP2620393.1 bacterio-opsin activator [Candidatus Aminicenantes 